MQVQVENFALLGNVLNQAKNIYILVSKGADEDTLAAGLFLEESLSNLGKKVLVVAPGTIPESLRYLAKRVASSIPAKKTVVSFNWRENEVEKVSYNLKGENFNFVINPRNKKINPESVSVFNTGDDPDLIVTLGLKGPVEAFGFEPETLEGKAIVNIDKGGGNKNFGSLNFVYPNADSLSAILGQIIEKTKLPIKSKSLDLLMLGMRSATNNFEKVSDPTTFEAAAFCTKKQDKHDQKTEIQDQKNQSGKGFESGEMFRTKQITN